MHALLCKWTQNHTVSHKGNMGSYCIPQRTHGIMLYPANAVVSGKSVILTSGWLHENPAGASHTQMGFHDIRWGCRGCHVVPWLHRPSRCITSTCGVLWHEYLVGNSSLCSQAIALFFFHILGDNFLLISVSSATFLNVLFPTLKKIMTSGV